MKTSPIDFVMAGLCMFVNLCLSLFFISFLTFTTKTILGDYHVIADFFLFSIIYCLVSAGFLRLLYKILPIPEGSYSMDTKEIRILKLIISINELGGTVFLPFIPIFWKPLFFKLFGARIGRQVAIAGKFVEPWLIEFEEYAFLGGDAIVTAHAITFDRVILKRIKICKRATVGLGSIIMPGVEVGENSVIAAGSVVTIDTKIPPNELWGGIPAKKIKNLEAADIRA